MRLKSDRMFERAAFFDGMSVLHALQQLCVNYDSRHFRQVVIAHFALALKTKFRKSEMHMVAIQTSVTMRDLTLWQLALPSTD